MWKNTFCKCERPNMYEQFEQLFAGVADFVREMFSFDAPTIDGNISERFQHTMFPCPRVPSVHEHSQTFANVSLR